MNEIYVVGHRNPDTDSIVAAMSYAALRNALGDRNYVAAYQGHVSDETQRLLNRFGFQPPQLIQNVRTQVRVPAPGGGEYRVDFELVEAGILGEVDGRQKYTNPDLRDGRSADRTLYDEKRREESV